MNVYMKPKVAVLVVPVGQAVEENNEKSFIVSPTGPHLHSLLCTDCMQHQAMEQPAVLA